MFVLQVMAVASLKARPGRSVQPRARLLVAMPPCV
jgi:hypothetical protein